MVNYETIFNDSFRRIQDNPQGGDHFFKVFYDRFISSSPEVAEKFEHTDMAAQRRVLKGSFYHVLNFFVTKEASDYLADIALTHDRHHRDIRPDLYDLWLECLIHTVEEHDDKFSDEVELAWRLVMVNGITYMKFKYDH